MSATLNEAGLPHGYPFRPDWEITPRRTHSLLADPSSHALLLDCRRDDELPIAAIRGAVHIPMDQVERRAEELEDDQGGRDHPIAVICHTGRRSLRVTATLRAIGFSNVHSVAGGIDLWSQDVDPAIPRY